MRLWMRWPWPWPTPGPLTPWGLRHSGGPLTSTIEEVKTVVLGPRPAELEQLIERRRAQGSDTFDEVWEGAYHLAPAPRFRHAYLDNALAVLLDPYVRAARLIGSGPFNLGQADDFRVPDRGLHRQVVDAVFLETAAVVVEIVSPDDQTYEKLPFYADHRVEELLIVDPEERRVRIFMLEGGAYAETGHSALLGVDGSTLEAAISWP